MNQRNKRITSYFILFSLILILGVVYAILQANLQINGTAKISQNSWDIHFANIQVNPNSVPIGIGDSAATIDPQNDCKVDFEVTLSIPGDFYEFTVDVVNDGTIDGMIGTLEKTLKVNNVEVQTVPDYLIFTVTYEDGIEIEDNHILEVNATETYLVHLEFNRDIDELPNATTISTSIEPQYIQADSNAVIRPLPDFADDSWETIISNVHNNTIPNYYTVGSTKEVTLGNNLGTHTLRIANMSTPSECSTTGFSQTACGFVLEFADTIGNHVINNTDTSIGGWPASAMRTYLNDINDPTSIINSLPEVLKNAIIDTTVVSGHGSNSGETNFTSIDKLYLLSAHEVWEDDEYDFGNGNGGIDSWDTAYDNTRQLDYYAGLGVTTTNCSGAIKNNGANVAYWWLRTAVFLETTPEFIEVESDGYWNWMQSNAPYDVSPAFRLG